MLRSYHELSECRETAAAAADSHELSRGVHPVRGVSETFPPVGASASGILQPILVVCVLKTLMLERTTRVHDGRKACVLGDRYTQVIITLCQK